MLSPKAACHGPASRAKGGWMEGMGCPEGAGVLRGGQGAHAQPGSHMGCCVVSGCCFGVRQRIPGDNSTAQDTHAVINMSLIMKGRTKALSAGRGRQDHPHHSRPKRAVGRGQSPAAGCDALANTSSSAPSSFQCRMLPRGAQTKGVRIFTKSCPRSSPHHGWG